MKVVRTCPLGHECEKIGESNGEHVIERCMWYENVRGRNPNTGEDVDKWMCAIPAQLMGTFQVGSQMNGLTAAVESNRNHVASVGEKLARIPVKELTSDS